ncbi:class I adenylate-forming enzyme family protein, partial [Cribrihabitans sp. XS_ASV171]
CSGAGLGLRPGDIYQGAFPFFTSSALNLAAMSCWVAGASLVIEGQIDTHARLSLIASEGTGFYHGVPSVLNFMAREYDPERHDLSGLRTIAYGGATMPGELVTRIAAIWPRARQVQIYGMTESGPAGTVLPPECMDNKPGSVGRVMPEMELAILDEAGQPVPRGKSGEIALSGPSIALGYFHDPDATARAFAGRRVVTGDIGRLDADGFLVFEDRKKDLINRGGFKIASARVEQVLYRHPDVLEAAVIAIPHPDLGEDIAACVVLRDPSDTDPDRLEAFCREHLTDNEVPRRFAVLEQLPKSPMGKVLKTELRAFWAGLQH